jgi:hypothetical protein
MYAVAFFVRTRCACSTLGALSSEWLPAQTGDELIVGDA